MVYILIDDTITDRQIERITNLTMYTRESNGTAEEKFKDYWQHDEAAITETLQQYNIISQPDIEIETMEMLKARYGLVIEYSSYDEGGRDGISIWVKKINGKGEKVTSGLYGKVDVLGVTKVHLKIELHYM
ncbi:MAG: hypothetical protein LBK13_11255 [Spirochaetales bacterium]|jgi:hypothetical protein|nr:hypothetical protein [Spirochaetales bacterium]